MRRVYKKPTFCFFTGLLEIKKYHTSSENESFTNIEVIRKKHEENQKINQHLLTKKNFFAEQSKKLELTIEKRKAENHRYVDLLLTELKKYHQEMRGAKFINIEPSALRLVSRALDEILSPTQNGDSRRNLLNNIDFIFNAFEKINRDNPHNIMAQHAFEIAVLLKKNIGWYNPTPTTGLSLQ